MTRYKQTAMIVLAAAMAVGTTIVPAAASRKKISSVNLSVTSDMRIGDDMDPAQIEIEEDSEKYYVESCDITNTGFYWTEEDVPRIEVYLTAEEGYYFSLKSSDVHLDGATYVEAVKPSGMDSTQLKITMDLPSMAGRMDEIETVTLEKNGMATWNAVQGAGQYEVRLIRNSTTVGGTQTVQSTTVDFGYLMTKAANYTVKVRPVSRVNWEVKGKWASTGGLYIDSMAAAQFRSDNPDGGEWVHDENGWWFRNEDGSNTAVDWQKIDGKWYYFNEQGYMLENSWVKTGEVYYYVGADGSMLRGAYVPDTEYYVDSTGAWVQE